MVRGLVAVTIVVQSVLACARFDVSPLVDGGGAVEASVVQPSDDATILPANDPIASEAGGMRVRSLHLVAINANRSLTPLDAAPFYDGFDGSLPRRLFADGNVTIEAVVEALPAGGSVVFTDNGSSKGIENNPPYTLSPVGRDASSGWQPSVSPHVIVATPFSGDGAGDAGVALRATITITP